MVKRSSQRWGLLFFLTAAVIACGAVGYAMGAGRHLQLMVDRRALPGIGLGIAVLALFTGHVSYPRIQNLKVYLAGYLIGTTGICYFLVQLGALDRLGPQQLFIAALLVITSLNAILLPLVPSFVKYRVTRQTTWLITLAELLFLCAVAAFPGGSGFLWRLVPSVDTPLSMGIGLAAPLASIALTLWLVREEFHLGGVLAGTALLQGCAWGSWLVLKNAAAAEMLLVACSGLYFIVTSAIHLFIRMEHRIAYDPLLHIFNREFCTRVLAEQSRIDTRPPFVIAMVDIDHFKNVNDTHGHQAGDLVLVGIAQTVSRCVVPDGVLCRYGGEELAVFFPRMTVKEVMPIMEEVRTTVESTKIPAGKKKLSVTVSSGLAQRETLAQTLSEVLGAADKALYRAKKGGRNQVKSGKVAVAKT